MYKLRTVLKVVIITWAIMAVLGAVLGVTVGTFIHAFEYFKGLIV